jgi:hypothetical protein
MADGPRVMEMAVPIDDKEQVLPPHLTFMYRDAREGKCNVKRVGWTYDGGVEGTSSTFQRDPNSRSVQAGKVEKAKS